MATDDKNTKIEQVFLTRSWRMLSSELSGLLNEAKFNEIFQGSAARLPRLLESMQTVAQHATVPLNEQVVEAEEACLRPEDEE